MSLKFSIITPSFNHRDYIRDTIESVLSQGYGNFEHIIVDGGSTDGTVEILKEYPHLKWISEKDTGPANAINKGFKLASGDIYTWLNSDDFYDTGVLNCVSEVFENQKDVEFLSGNLTFIDRDRNMLYKDTTVHYDKDFLINVSADIVRQPCTFYTADLFNKAGALDENLKLVFDYDLFIRFLEITKPVFINKNFVFLRDYPDTLSRKFIKAQAVEIFKTSRKHGGKLFSKLNKKNLKKYLLKKL